MSAGVIMNTLLEALNAALAASGDKEDMCALTLYPGTAVPIDYGSEGCGGMAWVRLIGANPTQAFPAQDLTVHNCAYSLAYVIEMGIMRPSPIPENFGQDMELPDDIAHFNSTMAQVSDMELMHRAIKSAAQDIPMLILGSYTPAGPEGGAVGGIWDLTAGDDDDG